MSLYVRESERVRERGSVRAAVPWDIFLRGREREREREREQTTDHVCLSVWGMAAIKQ